MSPDKVSYNKINVIKSSPKKEKSLLPHQQPGFKDDCARYFYWYYVQLIHQAFNQSAGIQNIYGQQ
ncbi:MAG: hypothetical protein KatS3mg028_0481 [Bacteroidia bacterium]|nr:MAG: hypothetical protein KatS3mg028_0481 [Bacteroidia bacterium]